MFYHISLLTEKTVSLNHAMLGLLRENDMSGYDLKKQAFDNSVCHIWNADQAQIYRTLERLHKQKLVSVKRVRQNARPDKKTYHLTDRGREELVKWLRDHHSHPALRNPFMLQMRFAEELPDPEISKAILLERIALQKRLDELRANKAAHERIASPGLPRRHILHRMTLDGAITQIRSTIDWLDDCMDFFDSS